MDIFKLSVFCAAVCVILKLIGSVNAEIKLAAALLAVSIVAGHFLTGFEGLVSAGRELFSQTGLDESYLTIVFRSLGICYVTQIACDHCRDSGENALASQLELAGRAALLIAALPMFSAAAETVKSLLML